MKGYIEQLKYWKEQFEKKNLLGFKNFDKIDPASECIAKIIAHFEGLHKDFEIRFDIGHQQQRPIRLRLNNFIKISFDSLCRKHQRQVSY